MPTPTPPEIPAHLEDATPLMKQYWELKSQAGDALMLFRMGDFYELFGDDAVTASRLLEITLTSRDKGKANPLPMAGVPHHSAQGYIQRLLKLGRKVAIAEQIGEAPAAGAKGPKAIVKRELTRVFTPAVQFDQEGSEPTYLATAVPLRRGTDATAAPQEKDWRLACLDPATGDTRLSDLIPAERLAEELASLPIRHFLRLGNRLPEEARAAVTREGTLFEDLPDGFVGSEANALDVLKRHYGMGVLDSFVPDAAAARSLAALIHYTARAQHQERLAHLRLPLPLHPPRSMRLGPRTAQHLDLVPPPDGGPSVYGLLNRTRSAPGARQLRRWLLEPLSEPSEIASRQEAVRALASAPQRLAALGSALANAYDLDRILGRVNARLANPRDTLALGRSLALLPALSAELGRVTGATDGAAARATEPQAQTARPPELASLRDELAQAHERLGALASRIVATQREDAPLVAREGGIFAPGANPELDRLIELGENGSRWLVELEARERQATGIPSLKVRYNRVFGYYIEVTQTHLKSVPGHYQRKQTTVGAERFFTEELKKFEDDFVHAEHRRKTLEAQLFEELVSAIQAETPAIARASDACARLDALQSLACLAGEPGWSFPEIDSGLDFDVEAGRHPLVETSRTSFVPNDLRLSPGTRRTLIITGPNMGGKSTVMRQAAVIAVLGQMGAPVPARRARWGAVTQLHTRIGAHDAIARGQSTFMVEMSELAHILHHADERSLIVLDEIGRGTSTYDGMSVAWAALEHIARETRARTLFATHYHELTRLAGELPGVANAHMGVEAPGGPRARSSELRFLYELREGPANESFGVHVARLAGLPAPVVARAWRILEELEAAPHPGAAAGDPNQLSLFASAPEGSRATEPAKPAEPEPPHPVLVELEGADLDRMTPIQAMGFLDGLRTRLRESVSGSPRSSA